MSSLYENEKQRYQQDFLKTNGNGRSGQQEEVRTTPLLSLAVKHAVEENKTTVESRAAILPDYALLGFATDDNATDTINSGEPIMMNVNAPNSAFICGSQGSGKSYTLSAMLENCLLPDVSTGKLTAPLAGVVFHYDIDSASSVAEVAYLCSRGIDVRVLASPSNVHKLKNKYGALAVEDSQLAVSPFLLQDHELTIERMHKLMAFSEHEGSIPLYMEVIQRLLRQMAMKNQTFRLGEFLHALEAERFADSQKTMMNMRFNLLKSFMEPPPPFPQHKKGNSSMVSSEWKLTPGTLTIIDFSDPLIDQSTACVLFDICLSLCKEKRPKSGLVVALDEAHKFMNKSAAATNFTDRLLTTIREQRHNATRVVIATQEPTISEKLLDLCSVSIVHHFNSPAWFVAIKDHLGGASAMVASKAEQEAIFHRIIDLNVGESLVFSPSSFLCLDEDGHAEKVGSRIVKMKTRLRRGVDGGLSVLATGLEETDVNMGKTI